jgi:hypothetical protein
MARPSYKTLFEQEKAKRAEVAKKTKETMIAMREELEDVRKQARTIVENNTDYGAREVLYLQQITDLQTEVARLKHFIRQRVEDPELYPWNPIVEELYSQKHELGRVHRTNTVVVLRA